MDIDYKQWANADEWLNSAQLAALTKTSKTFWRRARAGGDGPPWTLIGSTPHYRRADIEAWIISSTIGSATQGRRL